MIRVLHVIGSLELGGSQAMVMNLYRQIDRSKIQFDFMIFHNKEKLLEKEITNLGGKIFFIKALNGKNFFRFIKDWKNFLDAHPEYLIIHGHVRSVAAIYLFIAKKLGRATIAHSHSTSNGKGIVALIKNILQIPIRFIADYLFACSEEAGKWLYGKGVVNKENYMVIPNSIDCRRFNYNEQKRNEMRQKLKIEDKYVIGHIGRFTEPKNHEFLLKVFLETYKKNKNCRLLLVGDGELKGFVENKCREFEIEKAVIFAGNQVATEDYYQAMDIFVFPSLWEGLAIAVIEAQTSGLSCIISERIPKEVVLNKELVKILRLDLGANNWATEILSSNVKQRRSQVEITCKAGYDVVYNARKIEKFYIDNNLKNLDSKNRLKPL